VVTEVTGQVLRDEPLNLDPGRLVYGRSWYDPVVAYQWVGQHQDLSGVRRVGERFDIAGHTGVEDNFPSHDRPAPEAFAVKDRPILERESHGNRGRRVHCHRAGQSRSNLVS